MIIRQQGRKQETRTGRLNNWAWQAYDGKGGGAIPRVALRCGTGDDD